METPVSLSGLKPLSTDQYDRARNRALTRVQRRIGNRPTRADFHRELDSLFTLLDGLMFAVFIPAFVVSSIHILQHMGALANASYPTIATYSAGTVIERDLYTAVHQWALIPLAEASMLLFLVMFAMTKREDWRKWVFLALATVATAFVVIANAGAGLGLESLLAPIFTIGVGLHLESLIVRQLERRADVNSRYLAALATWEAASKDSTKHPDYVPILKQEVWAALLALTSNRHYADAPVSLKHAAVRREMERDIWAYEGGTSPIGELLPTMRSNGSHPESEGKVQPENPLELPSITQGNGGGESV